MPNYDHSGPRSEGPMTGRKQGDCNRRNATQSSPRLGLNRRGKGRRNNPNPQRRQGRNYQ